MKTVTLGIPTYGGANLLNLALNSIHKSVSLAGYSNFDVLVVDDGSPANEAKQIRKVVKTWSDQIENLRLFRGSKNMGNVARDNTIVEESEGDIIVLLDSDVIVPNRWFCSLFHFLSNNKKVGVASYLSEKVSMEQATELMKKRHITAIGSGRAPERATQLASYAYGFTRESYKLTSGFDERFKYFTGDSDFCVQLAEKGLMSYRLLYPMVYHFEHATYNTYPELKANQTMKRDVACFHKKWGASPKQTEQKFLEEIKPQQITWYANYAVKTGWDDEREDTFFGRDVVPLEHREVPKE